MGPAVPFLGPCLGSFFEVFCIKVAEAQRFGFNEALWLMATGRATVPTLYACCLTKRSCHFLFVARVGLCCWAIFRSHFWYRQTVPKMGPWKCFSSVLLSRLQKRNVLVSMKLCGLWRPEGQLGRPFWAKPVLRRLSGPRIGSVGASCFVDDFVSCWGKRGAYRLLLEPSWS